MKTTGTILRSAVAMVALVTSAGPAAAHDFGRWWASTPSQLEGTWEVTIAPYNCETNVALPTTIKAYHTFNAGGTMVEATAGNNFQPGQRAPGLGFWERTGWQSYRSVFQAFILFDSPSSAPPPQYKRGIQRFDQGIEITDGNHWTSDALVTFEDATGATVPPSGCAHVTAERMQ
jgi:hypothetical protein